MAEIDFATMLPLYGAWAVSEDQKTVHFTSENSSGGNHGLLLLGRPVDDGIIECTFKFPEPSNHCGAFIVFRGKGQDTYYAAGLGGGENAYTLMEGRDLSLTRLAGVGNISSLLRDRAYKVRVVLGGQRVQIFVDGVKIIDFDRLMKSEGCGVGVLALKDSGGVEIGPLTVDDRRPNAFVAMQFSDPYNDVYSDAIKPLLEEIGYDVTRVDEISQPGLILNDIWHYLTEASVVLAEVTEADPHVYYEIGVAQAMHKPTILLAQKGTKLPFDLGPHRSIFYKNTIPGRARLLDALKSSLTAILGTPMRVS